MATQTVNFQGNTGQDGVVKLGTFPCETRIQVQLKSGQSIRLAKDKSEITMDAIQGVNGGLEITSQMGIIELFWLGDLWVGADSNGAVVSIMKQGCRCGSHGST